MCRAANIKFYKPNACSSCFKQYFPFLPGGENTHNYIIKSIASTHYFIKSIASSLCVEDTPGCTLVHTLIHDKHSPACWMSRKLRPKSKTIPCYTADCSKSSSLPCLVLQRDFRFVSRNCHARDIALNRASGLARIAFKSSSVINLVYSYLYRENQTRFECSLLF